MADERRTLGAPAPALPSDRELVDQLERAVNEVFATMIGACDRVERFDGVLPVEARACGGVQVVVGAGRLSVDREAVVEFRGPLSGRVALRAGPECAISIARGLLMIGPDDPLSSEDVDDALKECANMLTGWLKSQTLDPLGAFSMSVPFIKGAERDLASEPSGAMIYRTAGGLFALEVSRRACSGPASAEEAGA